MSVHNHPLEDFEPHSNALFHQVLASQSPCGDSAWTAKAE